MKTCPICNAQLADNATECNFCGTRIASQPTAASAASASTAPTASTAPVSQSVPSTESLPKKPNGKPVGKQKYLLFAAPLKTRIKTYILLALALACVVFIMTTSSSIQNRDFTKIGIIDMLVDDEDIADFNAERDEILDEIEYLMDEDDDDLIEAFEEDFGMGLEIEEIRDIVEEYSLKAMVVILATEDAETANLLNTLLTGMTISAIFSAVLVVLASLMGWTWLVIVNYIFSILYYIVLAGMGSFVAASILFIALAVLMKKQNKAYKRYKETVLYSF